MSQENKSPANSQFSSPTGKVLEDVSNSGAPSSPSKTGTSPTKSSISKRSGQAFRSSAFDPETGIWEDENTHEVKRLPEGRYLHRHAKSVTFDNAPPQVNEYEMTTPDPSSVASGSREGSYDTEEDEEEGEYSFERGSSMDHDDSFDASLEDTEKTPVVLPEDWRFMSPEAANTALTKGDEDVFDGEYGSPGPTADPGALAYRPHQISLNSVDSNGERRPLPPLPPGAGSPPKSPGRDSLSGALERMSNSHRNLPSPPQAAMVSKSDIRRMSGSGLSMNDRLRLMMAEKEQDAQRERRMRRADQKDASPVRSPEPAATVVVEPVESIEPAILTGPTHISRESILRHMRSEQDFQDRAGSEESSVPSHASYDPDVPIPSMEDPTVLQNADLVIIKREEDEEDNGLYSIPDMYARQDDEESVTDHEDIGSQYSQPSLPSMALESEDGQSTPRATSPARGAPQQQIRQGLALPDFMADFGKHTSFNSGLESFMTPPTEEAKATGTQADSVSHDLPDLAALRNSIQRPYTPQDQFTTPQPTWDSDEPGTPTSVIRHPAQESDRSISPISAELDEQIPVDEPLSPKVSHEAIPSIEKELPAPPRDNSATGVEVASEQLLSIPTPATSSASGLKGARVSSLVQLEIPKDQSDEGLSFGLEKEFDRVVEAQKVEFERSLQHLYYPFNGRFPSNELPDTKASPLKYGSISTISHGSRPIIGRFANRPLNQQRGYLMRQNTKVVVASERISQDESRAAENTLSVPQIEPNEVVASPRKTSQPTWTAEPWNGKSRRKSIRVGGETSPGKRKEGPAPPLPGQASAVDALGAVTEDDLAEEEAEDFEDGAERGRLFVKVIGVKDLQLPFPQRKLSSIDSPLLHS